MAQSRNLDLRLGPACSHFGSGTSILLNEYCSHTVCPQREASMSDMLRPIFVPLLPVQPLMPRLLRLAILHRRHRRRQHAPWQRRQLAPRRLSRFLRQHRIHNDQCGHGFHNRHRPRHHAWIMPSLCFQYPLLTIIGRCLLGLPYRRRRLKSYPEVDVCAIGYSTLHAA